MLSCQRRFPRSSRSATKDLKRGAEVELVDMDRREFRLRDALHALDAEFDFIIIDSPPSLGLLTL